jgi:hypothetical protein
MVSTDHYPLLKNAPEKEYEKEKFFLYIYRHTILFRMNKKTGFLYS